MLPLDQLAMWLNGWVANTSFRREKNRGDWTDYCANLRWNDLGENSSFTLVLGWMMVSPCLLIAIKTMSGKPSSDVCWKQIYEDEWENFPAALSGLWVWRWIGERGTGDGGRGRRLESFHVSLTFTSKKAQPKVGQRYTAFRKATLASSMAIPACLL